MLFIRAVMRRLLFPQVEVNKSSVGLVHALLLLNSVYAALELHDMIPILSAASFKAIILRKLQLVFIYLLFTDHSYAIALPDPGGICAHVLAGCARLRATATA